MSYKAVLPLLLLLLLAGQMSAEFCMAQCEGMRMTEPACTMHGMSHGHCASCKHASANGVSTSLSTLGICCGQTCNSVLGLVQNLADHEIKPLVGTASIDILAPPLLEGTHPVRLRDTRSIRYILLFDPLISSLRI
jgi:hypothetical protein